MTPTASRISMALRKRCRLVIRILRKKYGSMTSICCAAHLTVWLRSTDMKAELTKFTAM